MATKERKDRLPSKAETEQKLSEIRADFATHILSEHKGVPATTCHKCLSFEANIDSYQYNLDHGLYK